MPFADSSCVYFLVASHVVAPRSMPSADSPSEVFFAASLHLGPWAMPSADSSSDDQPAASHVAAPWAMPSADASSNDRPAAAFHMAAQPDAGWLASIVYNKHHHFHRCRCLHRCRRRHRHLLRLYLLPLRRLCRYRHRRIAPFWRFLPFQSSGPQPPGLHYPQNLQHTPSFPTCAFLCHKKTQLHKSIKWWNIHPKKIHDCTKRLYVVSGMFQCFAIACSADC